MSTSQDSKLTLLKDRAQMFTAVRSFFAERGILEVDCPALSPAASIDLHIEVISVLLKNGSKRYLHTSPEYGMKRLLALGLENIYQMSHVFREGEIGALHNPEFTLIEWYRTHTSFTDFIEENRALIALFLGNCPYQIKSYRDLFFHHIQIDYLSASLEELKNCLHKHEISLSDQEEWDKDSLLNLIMTYLIEPHLGRGELTIVTDYPASQSALAQIRQKKEGEMVAERFEFYFQGIELGNGYHELGDPSEQRERLLTANQKRLMQGKEALPIDEAFINALKTGLPDCYGIALGFDRLMLLRHQATHLSEVIPFIWE